MFQNKLHQYGSSILILHFNRRASQKVASIFTSKWQFCDRKENVKIQLPECGKINIIMLLKITDNTNACQVALFIFYKYFSTKVTKLSYYETCIS